jgi:glycosyltransferase involved in cell wall biosynthesis
VSLADPANHHGSHTHLLHPLDTGDERYAEVDAVIVPTARPVAYLHEAMRLARGLGCPVLALCSRWASAVAAEKLGWELDVEVLAIDVRPDLPLPAFQTDRMLAGTKFDRRTDTSLKRNLGLVLAKAAGWRRVVFLDDDIAVPELDDLRRAAGLLATHDAVGLVNLGYPDNSVVCHAHRMAGGDQDTFVGGGALLVSPGAGSSFFPSIYNEDWFFLLNDVRLRPVTQVGRVYQKRYDPFADPRRARAEEFGDCLAEGLFWQLDHGRRVQDAGAPFWAEFLIRRQRFIEDVITRVRRQDLEPGERDRMIAALRAAEGRRRHITAELCVAYLRAWRGDQSRWRRYLAELPPTDIETALAGLRLPYHVSNRSAELGRAAAGLAS